MIVVVGGIKGGTGKSIIATNLTVIRSSLGKKVLLIDGDSQQTAKDWSEQRDDLGNKCLWITTYQEGIALKEYVKKNKQKYDDIIIDTAGRESDSLRAAIAVSDVLIVPFRPRSPDLGTLKHLEKLIQLMNPINPKLRILSFLTQADFKGADNEDSIKIIKKYPRLGGTNLSIGSRKSFPNAYTQGLGVIEIKPKDIKATKEIMALHDFIYKKRT